MRRIELVERFYNFSLLGSLTDMEVWIGGNDLADDDDWVWTGGEPVTGDVWGRLIFSSNMIPIFRDKYVN